MSVLDIVYASRPVDEYIIRTLEIRVDGLEPIRICQGYQDRWLMVDGVPQLFEAGTLSVSLPAENATGNQTLSFAVSGVSGVANDYVERALESGGQAIMIYREYLESDITAPARKPYVMQIIGGAFEGVEAIFEGGYYDLLNSAWPRDRYTSANAPGVQYL